MAVYRVFAQSIDNLYIDIEADSPDEAFDFAEECLDGSEFIQEEGDWIMEREEVYELPEGSIAMFNTKESED